MPLLSQEILERFRKAHGKDIDLSLRSAYSNLLARLGNPQQHLPPALLVAGTNGKGSTCAFLRAMVEASDRTAHVYTSPDLITFHERIRIAGHLITEDELAAILQEAEALAQPGGVSLFEAQTTAAFVAFARHPADLAILEIGLGGRLDATNVVPNPVASLIARLSFDHRDYLGNSMAEIAGEKAGIMRSRTPCFTMPQPSLEALHTLQVHAASLDAPLFIGGQDWSVEETGADTFRFTSAGRTIEDLPRPALVGAHQLWNAGLAIASLAALPFTVPDEAVRAGMLSVQWPGRLQRLTQGAFVRNLPQGCEVWIDGGHNDSAGEVLALQCQNWREQDDKPLDLVFGMLSTKVPEEFLAPLRSFVRNVRTLSFPSDIPSLAAHTLAARVTGMGFQDVCACGSLREAFDSLPRTEAASSRTLICGSLHLAGHALRENGA